MKKYTSLWFGIGFAVLLLLAATSPSVYVPWTAIRGTNEVLVTTNPSTGRIIIGPATPISTQINAAQVWTNAGTTLHPTVITPVVIGNDALIARGTLRVSNTNYNSSTGLLYGDGGTMGLWSGANPSTGGDFTNGEYAAVVGFGGGVGFVHYGVIGACEPNLVQGGTNVGVAGIATPFGSSGIYVGGFFAVSADDTFLVPNYVNAAILADTLNQGGPIFIARTNNGTFTAFQVNGDKTTNATPLDVAGLSTLYGGIKVFGTGQIATADTANTNFIFADSSDNTSMGLGSGNQFLGGAAGNTAFGSQALARNISGTANTAFGYLALQRNTNGGNNTAFGNSALWLLTTGSGNAAFGFEAINSLTTGTDNTAGGYDALDNITTGSRNSSFGRESFHNLSAGHNDNAALGYRAGYQSDGHKNTFLGDGADTVDFPGAETNSTAIGYNAKLNADNQIMLGNGLVTHVVTPGYVRATNGFATILNSTATNTLITVGSSPFNFTNTASQTIVLYLDANGATTTAALNGQTIFKSLVAGDHTIILKPSAYTTVTYSVATPIMTWTEL